MDIGIGVIIFIVFIVISIAQKFKERADIARDQQQSPQSKPGEKSDEARQILYGEEARVREAAPKGAAPARRQRAAPAKELMQALFGAEKVEPEEEAEWSPHAQRPAPPPIRREVVARHVESRVQHEPVHEGAVTREEDMRLRRAQEAQQRQHEAQQRAREEKQEPRARQKQAPRRKTAGVPRTPPTRRQRRERIFGGAHEVRKAIVFAEILGPPKAFQDR